jgi:hypothetical protein
VPMSSMPEESEDGTREDAVELENDQGEPLEDDVAQIDDTEEDALDGAEGDGLEEMSTLSARASEDPDMRPQGKDALEEGIASPDRDLKGEFVETAEDSPSIPDDTPSVQVCLLLSHTFDQL